MEIPAAQAEVIIDLHNWLTNVVMCYFHVVIWVFVSLFLIYIGAAVAQWFMHLPIKQFEVNSSVNHPIFLIIKYFHVPIVIYWMCQVTKNNSNHKVFKLSGVFGLCQAAA